MVGIRTRDLRKIYNSAPPFGAGGFGPKPAGEKKGKQPKPEIVALVGLSLEIAPGEVFGLLGPNGAGKTTTLRAISGFLGVDDARISEGSIRFKGTRIDNELPHKITGRGIVLVPEREKVFPNLTVAENLAAPVSHAARSGEKRRIEERAYHFFPRLAELRSRTAGLLSGGER